MNDRVLSPYMLVVPRPGKIKKKIFTRSGEKKKISTRSGQKKNQNDKSWGYLTQTSKSDQNWPHEQSDPVTARTRLNWSNAEGKGSMQHGERKKVAYRAPAAQDCKPPYP